MWNLFTLKQVENLVYIYTNNKLLWKWFGVNYLTWYKKNNKYVAWKLYVW
jgi:hypothetical protein